MKAYLLAATLRALGLYQARWLRWIGIRVSDRGSFRHPLKWWPRVTVNWSNGRITSRTTELGAFSWNDAKPGVVRGPRVFGQRTEWRR